MQDRKELVERLREEPMDSRKAAMSIMDLCIDAADEIETLESLLAESEAARADLGKRLAAAQQEMSYYMELERDGKLVVLPCKVGDIVWLLKTKCKYAGEDNKPWESCNKYWDNVYKREHMWGCAGRDDDGKEFRCEKEDREWYAQSMEYSLVLYGPDIVLGKNLFLSREAAEAALEGGRDE